MYQNCFDLSFFVFFPNRYCDHWRFVNQRLTFLAAFVIYLEQEKLITREELTSMLGGKNARKSADSQRRCDTSCGGCNGNKIVAATCLAIFLKLALQVALRNAPSNLCHNAVARHRRNYF